MTIARHRIIDVLRTRDQRQRLVAVEDIDIFLTNFKDPVVDVEKEVWLREDSAAIIKALQTLPSEQRRVLLLAYFGGLSQSTIAKHLGWPLGTVKKRIRLGMQKLRVALAPRHNITAQNEPIAKDIKKNEL